MSCPLISDDVNIPITKSVSCVHHQLFAHSSCVDHIYLTKCMSWKGVLAVCSCHGKELRRFCGVFALHLASALGAEGPRLHHVEVGENAVQGVRRKAVCV